ncbi:MAG: NAD-dependent epimerase/dehydratase family protein [Pseudomonadota bacterium]
MHSDHPLKGRIVLVTGATGFTGRVLVERLAALGCHVRAIVRSSSDRSALEALGVDIRTGDVFDETVIADACRGVHVIFHVAAAYREPGIKDEMYTKVHVESTRYLAACAAQEASLLRFVHVSTVGVHGHIESPPADETAPFAPGDVYQDTKAEAELWIRDFAKSEAMPLTVIRPAAIFGPGDSRLLKVFKFARLPVVPLIGKTRGLYHLIHVEDLVAFMILAAAADDAAGEVFICGNEVATSIREMIQSTADLIGTRPRFVRIPAAPVFGMARLVEVLCKALGLAPPIYPRRVAFFTKDRAFDTAKMRGLAGFEYKYDNASGIAATVRAYRDSGAF